MEFSPTVKKEKKIRSRDYDEMVRMVHARQGLSINSSVRDHNSHYISIFNDTGTALEYGAVLGVSGVLNDPTDDVKLNMFRYGGDGAMFKGILPTSADAGKFLVTQEPIVADGFGVAVISGPAKVQIDVVSASHGFADVIDGDVTMLRSNGTSGAPILYKETGTGTKWGIVNLGGGSGGGRLQFDVYQTAATPSVPATDWRNVQVTAGRLYSGDVTGTAADILVPASTTAYKIWMQATTSLFTISSAAITHAATVGTTVNWRDYPKVRTTTDDAGNGYMPARAYILIAEVTTSDDTAQTLSITQHWRGPMAIPLPAVKSAGGLCYSFV